MFINDRFLLESDEAVQLYEQHARPMPIIDYHNHLDPSKIAEDYRFSSITELWLQGDHYKWRALRANGIGEKYITGDAEDFEKFKVWAETVPYTMRNPLYHWTHLELRRYFSVSETFSGKNAKSVFDKCNELLKEPEFSTRGLLRRMNVEALCTTDDPADDLRFHKQIAADGFEVKVLPTFRPDKAMAVDDPIAYGEYVTRLGEAAGIEIKTYADMQEALSRRYKYFHECGCRISDHGLYAFPGADFDEAAMDKLFAKVLAENKLTAQEEDVFRSGILTWLAEMNHKMGWTQQIHVGAIRNNNGRIFSQLGPDAGCDSMADEPLAKSMSAFLNRLEIKGKLTKTVLYNLNPKDSEVMLSMAYNFNDGSVPGKMQYGAAWWFLDQMDGMKKQLDALSSGGLLSRFVGMLTDSRSFMSFPRHEYFRRILCNMLGEDIRKGHLPASESEFIGNMVEGICYRNAKDYLKL